MIWHFNIQYGLICWFWGEKCTKRKPISNRQIAPFLLTYLWKGLDSRQNRSIMKGCVKNWVSIAGILYRLFIFFYIWVKLKHSIGNGPLEDVFPMSNGDFPASFVGLPEICPPFFPWNQSIRSPRLIKDLMKEAWQWKQPPFEDVPPPKSNIDPQIPKTYTQ